MNIGNLIKNENQYWLDILVSDKNMDMEYLENIFPKVDYNLGLAAVATREKMLKSRTPEDEKELSFKFNVESLERTFLEPISKSALECIKLIMQENHWTLPEVYQECKQFGARIFLVISSKNETILEA